MTASVTWLFRLRRRRKRAHAYPFSLHNAEVTYPIFTTGQYFNDSVFVRLWVFAAKTNENNPAFCWTTFAKSQLAEVLVMSQ